MKPTTITAEHFTRTAVHGERFTNLGAGFHLDIGGATKLTIHRWGQGHHRNDRDEQPVIDWVNTYGNVSSNRSNQYRFSYTGALAAAKVLASIEADHATKEASK